MIDICYHFRFSNGMEKTIKIMLDLNSMELKREPSSQSPEWARLQNSQCSNCTLDADKNRFCPVALNISDTIDYFKVFNSFDEVDVTVKTSSRDYNKKTTVQKSLSSLLGIFMVASGCPAMEKLKPMVRFHLPFASVEETVFRAAGTYLLGQFFLHKQGKKADIQLKKLAEFYRGIQLVNQGIAGRLRDVVSKDAPNNAVICLDMFAKEMPYAVEDGLEEIENLFSAYWNN